MLFGVTKFLTKNAPKMYLKRSGFCCVGPKKSCKKIAAKFPARSLCKQKSEKARRERDVGRVCSVRF